MLTKEQLNPKLYPRECWINVYQYPKRNHYYYSHCCSLEMCMVYEFAYEHTHRKVVYRIHVRLK